MTTTNIENMTDAECIELVSTLIANRVQIGVGYMQDEETGILTHSFLSLKSGDVTFNSETEPLVVPFIPLLADDKARTIN